MQKLISYSWLVASLLFPVLAKVNVESALKDEFDAGGDFLYLL